MQTTFWDIQEKTRKATVATSRRQLARSTDPETSKIAAEATVKCGLNENQALFVATLRKSVIPLTAQEIAERAVEITDVSQIRQTMAKRDSVRKRAKELVDLGWVKVCDSRECKVTGQMAQTYEVI